MGSTINIIESVFMGADFKRTKIGVSGHTRRVNGKNIKVRPYNKEIDKKLQIPLKPGDRGYSELTKEALSSEYGRNPDSMDNDESRANKETLVFNQENFERWKANPNKCDLQGIDTLQRIRRKTREFYLGMGLIRSTYTKEDMEKAKKFLSDHPHLYRHNQKYIELQAEIAKAISEGIDPEIIDWAAYSSDDELLAESLDSERAFQMSEMKNQ